MRDPPRDRPPKTPPHPRGKTAPPPPPPPRGREPILGIGGGWENPERGPDRDQWEEPGLGWPDLGRLENPEPERSTGWRRR